MKRALAVSLLLLLGVASLFVGPAPFSYEILMDIRLPRVVMALVEGAALGMSGALYQMVLRNPLADGFTTGVSSSCALGAVLAIALGLPFGAVAVISFAFGMGGLFLVYLLSRRDGVIEPVTMVLAGIVLNIVASSFIGLVKFICEESISSLVFWLMGSVYLLDFWKVLVVVALVLLSSGLLLRDLYAFNLLALDDYSAFSSGVDVSRLRTKGFVVATLLVAATVSVSGIIAFVGLMVPHLVRGTVGSDAGSVLFYSGVGGGGLLLLADTLSRSLLVGGSEVPVGVITSFMGGVFFLWLMFRRSRDGWG